MRHAPSSTPPPIPPWTAPKRKRRWPIRSTPMPLRPWPRPAPSWESRWCISRPITCLTAAAPRLAARRPVPPQSVYGRTKLAGEEAIAQAGGTHAILRTSGCFRPMAAISSKPCCALARSRDALTIVADQIGGPTAAADIASACLTLREQLQRTRPKAASIISQGRPTPAGRILPARSSTWPGALSRSAASRHRDYPTPARRPLNSRLDCAATETDFGIAPRLARGPRGRF